jgi:hypothetical protein
MQFSCATLRVTYLTAAAENGYDLQVCSEGTYKVIQSIGATGAGSGPTTVCPGTVPTSSTYQLTVTSNGTGLIFSINSQPVCTQNGNVPAASQIEIVDTDYGAGPGTMDVSNFSITPNG